MTDSAKLREKIKSAGLKLGYVASVLKLSHQGFINKLDNSTEFRVTEVQALCELLGLTVEEKETIFFAEKVDK